MPHDGIDNYEVFNILVCQDFREDFSASRMNALGSDQSGRVDSVHFATGRLARLEGFEPPANGFRIQD